MWRRLGVPLSVVMFILCKVYCNLPHNSNGNMFMYFKMASRDFQFDCYTEHSTPCGTRRYCMIFHLRLLDLRDYKLMSHAWTSLKRSLALRAISGEPMDSKYGIILYILSCLEHVSRNSCAGVCSCIIYL